MFKKNRWNLLYLILVLLLLFSLIGVPKIVVRIMNDIKGQVVILGIIK